VLAGQSSLSTLGSSNSDSSTQGTLVISESQSSDTYTYAGSYTPNSFCDSLGSGIKYSEENGGEVTVLLTTTANVTDCAQAADGNATQPFSVSIKHPGGEPRFMGVLVNGQQVPITLTSH